LRNTIISSGAKSSNRTGSPAMSETLTLRVLDSGIPGLKVCNLPTGVTWFFHTPKSACLKRVSAQLATLNPTVPRRDRVLCILIRTCAPPLATAGSRTASLGRSPSFNIEE
jgi:hypothetical protein